jgi:hypothetical protein
MVIVLLRIGIGLLMRSARGDQLEVTPRPYNCGAFADVRHRRCTRRRPRTCDARAKITYDAMGAEIDVVV